MSLTEFLDARIAEDEATARACMFEVAVIQEDRYSWASVDYNSVENAAHGTRWNPDRVLAECEAKRRVVKLHRPVQFTNRELGLIDVTVCWTCHGVLDEPEGWDEATDGEWGYPLVQDPWPCKTARALVAVHADHPDYESWRP